MLARMGPLVDVRLATWMRLVALEDDERDAAGASAGLRCGGRGVGPDRSGSSLA
jgi:hypothetical protein